MLKFCNKEKGAISVFLILIMLPMMVLSWIMIDGGRIQLAKDRINNLADLTYNTALSQYDQTLKDVYGLLAMSQDEKSLLSNLNDYYERSLMSAGLDPETSAALSDNIIVWLGDQVSSGNIDTPNYADFLKMEISDFTVSNPALSAVYNPNIMEEQIVDYMKYRAPLGIGVKIIQALKSFGSVADQSEVLEKKKEYYEKQQTLEDHLQKAWGYIEKYNNEMTASGNRINETGLTKINNNINGYKNKLTKPITDNKAEKPYSNEHMSVFGILCNLLTPAEPLDNSFEPQNTKYYHVLGSKSFGTWKQVYPNTNQLSSTDEAKLQNESVTKHEIQEDGYGTSPYYTTLHNVRYTNITFNNISVNFAERTDHGEGDSNSDNQKNILLRFNSAIETCANLSDGIKNLDSYRVIDIDQGSYTREFYDLYEQSGGTEENPAFRDTFSVLENYCDWDYEKMILAVTWINKWLDSDINTYISYMTSYTDSVSNLINYYYQLTIENQNAVKTDFEKYCKIYLRYWHDFYILDNAINDFMAMETDYKRIVSSADTVIKEIYNEQKGLHDDLINAKKYLTSARNELTSAKTEISGLDDAREKWGKSVTEKNSINGTDFGDGNLSEIDSLNNKFKQTDFEWLETRIDNIIVSLNELIDQVDSLKYDDTKLYELSGTDVLYNTTVDSQTYRDASPFDTATASSMLHIDTNLTTTWTVTSDRNCKHVEFGKSNNELYKYMSTQYAGSSDYLSGTNEESEKESKESDKKGYTDKAKDPEITNVPEINEGTDSSKTFKTSDVNNGNEESALPSIIYSGAKQADLDVKKMKELGEKDDPDSGISGGSEAASGFFSSALSKLSSAATEIRDDIYIMEYIMGMFSYQTIEKEFAVEKYNWNSPEHNTLSQKFQFYNFRLYNREGDNITNASFDLPVVTGIPAMTMDDFRAGLKTLSNEQICPQYNYAYLNEVEYIIYGDGGEKTAWLVIAGIRMLCNTIAAFMNSEITSLARTIAWSIFVGPLAFLAPIAQIAIIIAFAIGETIVDKKMLESGVSVPIFKTKETWMVSPSGLISAVKSEVAHQAKTIAYKAVDKVANELEEAIDGLDQAADDKIDETKAMIDEKFGELYDEKIGTHIDTAIDHIMKECEETMNTFATTLVPADWGNDGDITFEKILKNESLKQKLVNSVKTKIESWVNDSNDGELLGKAKRLVYEKFEEKIDQVVNDRLILVVGKAENGMDDAVTRLSEIPENIKSEVTSAIESGTGTVAKEIKKYKADAVKEAKDAVGEGKDKLKSVINDKLDGMLGQTGFENTSVSSSDAGSLLSLSYSGYLRLFLIISLLTGKQGILLRTADVIQTNMRLRTGKEDYCLSKSYSYMELNIEADLEPLFLSFDGLKKVLSSPDSSVDDDTVRSPYTISYSGRDGY